MFVNLRRMNGLGLPRPDPRFIRQSIYVEIVAAFFFQFALMSLYLDKRAPKDVHALGTGAMMAISILTIGPVSGGGMNPARAIGPAIISGNLGSDLLVFVGGPMAGSYLASLIYKELFLSEKSKFQTIFLLILSEKKKKPENKEEKVDEEEQQELRDMDNSGKNPLEGQNRRFAEDGSDDEFDEEDKSRRNTVDQDLKM